MGRFIISIDVGIRNLALCVLHFKKEFKILNWMLVDVLASPETTTKGVPRKKKANVADEEKGPCQNTIKRTGKPCGKMGPINTRGRAYCGTHDPSRKHTPSDTQAWCHHLLKRLPSITDDINRCIETKTKEDVLRDDNEREIEVYIEQQCSTNKKILLASHVIFAHFVSLFDNSVPVRFVPAYNKLLVYDGPDVEPHYKTPYANRKYFARCHARYFLEKDEALLHWKNYFEQMKTKQDDLADSFLQGLYILLGKSRNSKSSTTTTPRKRRNKVRW